MKKGFIAAAAFVFLCLGGMSFCRCANELFHRQDGVQTAFRTSGSEIQVCKNGDWKRFEITGVNIGTGYPGLFPNEFGISQETYFRWFEQIGQMNANSIRVYKIQSPEFYHALVDYNNTHDQILYLIQGVGFDETMMYSEDNLLESDYKEKLFSETAELIDAVHGKKSILNWKTGDLYCYTADVSQYVLGYILGIEWDDVFVNYLCRINRTVKEYNGTYIQTSLEANPFEIFLAEWADYTLAYEDHTYGTQKLISICNWSETDPLVNEIHLVDTLADGQERGVEAFVDVERLICTDNVRSGIFASYNVYPYFPSFLQHGDYTTYQDENGVPNPYRKYLLELVAHHTYPVVISEFGIPTSRSTSYEDIWRGFSHGGKSEQEQAAAVVALYNDILTAGCAGVVVFSWQDEWYKTVWNEKLLSDPDQRAYWSNAQCSEQFYGLLAFEPENLGQTSYPDGDLSEWSETELLTRNETIELYMKSDVKFVYFMVKSLKDTDHFPPMQIALDITPKSGKSQQNKTQYARLVDFLIRITPQQVSALYVDSYYDALLYSALGGFTNVNFNNVTAILEKTNTETNSTGFHIVSRADGNIRYTLNASWRETKVGRLKPGNANPESPDYDSNADYFISGNAVEIRIPWQLLNFYDPSQCVILDDFHSKNYQIQGLKIDEIYAAAYLEGETQVTDFGRYPLEEWDTPQFHERLKPAYYALQEAFAKGEAS